MIPLRDRNPTLRTPVVTYALLAANVVVFLGQLVSGPQAQILIERFGVVPYFLTSAPLRGPWITPLTSMFLHGGWGHILGNMWFLWVFGDNVEDRLGRVRYLVFYLASGLGAAALQVFIDPMSTVPMVGASGAISGVLGGYAWLFPRARVLTLIPIFVFLQFVELPALLLIAGWFFWQLVQAAFTLGLDAHSGIAFFAHVGGFVVGLLLARLFVPAPLAPSPSVHYTWRRD